MMLSLNQFPAGDCVASTIASSAGGKGTVVAEAAPNSHPASSALSSALTQQPASSWSAGAVGGPAVAALARTACGPCDVRRCQPVFPESCQGLIRKDSCSCCPICSSYEAAAGTGMLTTPVGKMMQNMFGFLDLSQKKNGSLSQPQGSIHRHDMLATSCS